VAPLTETLRHVDNTAYGQEPDTAYIPENEETSESNNATNGFNGGALQDRRRSHDDDDIPMPTERFSSNIKEDG